jgi:hypothetical protein
MMMVTKNGPTAAVGSRHPDCSGRQRIGRSIVGELSGNDPIRERIENIRGCQ